MIEKLKRSHKMSYAETVEKINELIDVVNAPEGQCINCKWWDIQDENAEDDTGRCLKAIEQWGPGGRDSLMQTLDGSRYMALLLTKPAFGCVLFEVKK